MGKQLFVARLFTKRIASIKKVNTHLLTVYFLPLLSSNLFKINQNFIYSRGLICPTGIAHGSKAALLLHATLDTTTTNIWDGWERLIGRDVLRGGQVKGGLSTQGQSAHSICWKTSAMHVLRCHCHLVHGHWLQVAQVEHCLVSIHLYTRQKREVQKKRVASVQLYEAS